MNITDLEPLLSFWNENIEHCGVISQNGTVIEIANIGDQVRSEFAMDRNDVLAEISLEDISGVWHTHPSNVPEPSQRDVDGQPTCGTYRYFTVTQTDVYEWSFDDGVFSLEGQLSGQKMVD